MDYRRYCKRCKHYEFNQQQGILCGLTHDRPPLKDECEDFLLDPEREEKLLYPGYHRTTVRARREWEAKERKLKAIEVCLPSGESRQYIGYDEIREDILSGNLKKDYKARIVIKEQSGKENSSEDIAWCTLERVADVDFELEALYRPVWAYMKKWLWYGVLGGIILRGIDTTVLFIRVDPALAFLWLLVLASVASLFFRMWWTLPIVLIFACRLGTKANLFSGVIIGVAIGGALFGGSLGMIIGTLLGHFKNRSIEKAADASPEGSRPYYVGIVLPIVILSILVPLFFFWLNPKLLESM